ncbi:MAG: hypothetical protein ACE5QV_02630 [Fidelibacterota bacterium]
MEKKKNMNEKFDVIEKRLDLIIKRLNSIEESIDSLVRFSITAKAFIEIALIQGIIDPGEVQELAKQYEKDYEDTVKRYYSESSEETSEKIWEKYISINKWGNLKK